MRLIDSEKLKVSIALDFFGGKKTLGHVIDDQPTAYDIDKVVEELYMHSVEEKIPTCLTHRIIDVDEAIEIVKAGGKNDKG